MIEFGDKQREPEKEVDRLGALPDSLLLLIIECLDLEEAAKTAILSKQWRFLWTNLPFPFFSTSKDIDGKRSFVASVHAALTLRRGPTLRTLSVAFDSGSRFDSDVDPWLDFAAKNKAKDVSLHLLRNGYTLPQLMYSNSLMTHLERGTCRTASPAMPVQWQSMKSLSLQHVDLRQSIGEITPGCPLLDAPLLEWYSGFNRVEIGGRSFHCLAVRQWDDLKISAPYMPTLILTVRLNSSGRTLRVGSVAALKYAYIQLDADDWETISMVEPHINVKKILRVCRFWKHLLLLYWFTHGLSMAEYVFIVDAAGLLNICGVISVLQFLPCLVNLCSLLPRKKESLNWDPIRRNLMHLQTVQFVNSKATRETGCIKADERGANEQDPRRLPCTFLRANFVHLHLEDKVIPMGWGVDTDSHASAQSSQAQTRAEQFVDPSPAHSQPISPTQQPRNSKQVRTRSRPSRCDDYVPY